MEIDIDCVFGSVRFGVVKCQIDCMKHGLPYGSYYLRGGGAITAHILWRICHLRWTSHFVIQPKFICILRSGCLQWNLLPQSSAIVRVRNDFLVSTIDTPTSNWFSFSIRFELSTNWRCKSLYSTETRSHSYTHTHIFFFISIELIAVFYWLYCIRKKQIWMEQLQYRMEFDKMTRMHFYFVLKTYCDIVPVLLTHFTRINY